MKILYIGTVSENNEYEKILKESRVKASAAPQAFETAFVKGFIENGIKEEDVQFLSCPMIASFPGSKKIFWGKKNQKIFETYDVTWVPTVNIQGLKMVTQEFFSKKLIRKWLAENKDVKDKCILLYSLYKPVLKNVLSLCEKYDCRCFSFVPDLPKHMYLNKSGIRAFVANRYVKKAVAIQGNLDGYIYLTEAMKDEIAPQKPYIVVEGIADVSAATSVNNERKNNVIMYAGAISSRYGFQNLIEAFSMLEGDYELHIYGYGDYATELEEKAKKNSRIKYFGRQPREEILKKEKEAALLVNVRNPDDEFTKYSFPSKTMEYMLSGTPLLTTCLSGIPENYFDYCISIKDNEPESIKSAIEDFFSLGDIEKFSMGERAREFIVTQKNQKVQSERVLGFLEQYACNND